MGRICGRCSIETGALQGCWGQPGNWNDMSFLPLRFWQPVTWLHAGRKTVLSRWLLKLRVLFRAEQNATGQAAISGRQDWCRLVP